MAEVCARCEAETTYKARAQIADDVAEHVLRNEDRVILRILEHPHADGVDVHFVGPDIRVILCYVAETARHQSAGLAQHVWFLNQCDALTAPLLWVFWRFFSNIW